MFQLNETFDTRRFISLFQIRDWLAVEEEMLRKQAVVVGDVGEIMEALDKQMVSGLSLSVRYCIFHGWCPFWLIFISISFSYVNFE